MCRTFTKPHHSLKKNPPSLRSWRLSPGRLTTSPQEGAFAWSDPDAVGSRLDPQTADFAWRAAELWTQAAGLREVSAGVQETDSQREARGGGETATLAVALEQVRPKRNGASAQIHASSLS